MNSNQYTLNFVRCIQLQNRELLTLLNNDQLTFDTNLNTNNPLSFNNYDLISFKQCQYVFNECNNAEFACSDFLDSQGNVTYKYKKCYLQYLKNINTPKNT